MANNVLELKKENNSQIQEIRGMPSRASKKKVIPRPTKGKLQNEKKKKKSYLRQPLKKRDYSHMYHNQNDI